MDTMARWCKSNIYVMKAATALGNLIVFAAQPTVHCFVDAT